MPGKIIEKDGERYIVSEDVDPDELDTDNLIEKDKVTKLVEEIHKAQEEIAESFANSTEVEEEGVFVNEPPVICTFKHGASEILILGFLVSMKHDSCSVYEIKFDKMEAIDLLFRMHDDVPLFITKVNVTIDDRTSILSLNEITGHMQSFSIIKFVNDNGICELNFGVKEKTS